MVIGVDVGGTKTALGLFDTNKRLLIERRGVSDPNLGPEAFFDGLIREIHALLSEAGASLDQVRGLGLGMPSFILFERGHIVKTTNLVKLRDFPARSYLTDRLGIPVVMDNDSHAAALAEYRLGAGKGHENMVYCAVSTGIASGFIIHGKLFRGSYGWAGETGHMIITPDQGIRCGCGNRGCLMSWCSGSMIVKHIQKWLLDGETSLMTELAGGAERIDCSHLEAAYDRGDALAGRALSQMARYLGIWFFNLYSALNIDCFVLGGGLLNMGEKLLAPMRQVFDQYNRNELPVYFKEAELQGHCGVSGAAELFYSETELVN